MTLGNKTIPSAPTPAISRPSTGSSTSRPGTPYTASQLWVSDGTTDGTQRVTDINPGFYGGIDPKYLKVFDGHLFFGANDGTGGTGLWESDGTTAGTFLLDDINPQTPYSFPEALTVVGNRLFFTADDGVNGRQLWATDGTAAGTGIVKVVNPQGDAFHDYKSLHADGRRGRGAPVRR